MTHTKQIELKAHELLEALKREITAMGRSAEEVDEERRLMLARGNTAGEIAACEFAELRLFIEMDSEDVAVSGAALAGKPSEATIAMAERDGYCLDCVRHYYDLFAHTFRTRMTS